MILAALICLIIAFCALMFFKAYQSKNMKANVGLVNDQLQTCGDKPNCISSSAQQGTSFYYPPIESNNIEVVWDNLNMAVSSGLFKIEKSTASYIHATATTKLLGFVDDLEFLLSEKEGKIYLRSASRVGYSDMGTNRKRMDKLVQEITK